MRGKFAVFCSAPAFGVWSCGFRLACPSRLHTMPYVPFYGLGCVLLPPWGKNRNLGFLGLGIIVLIRTGLGTMAGLVAFVVSLANFRNYLGVVIGTWHILADLYWLVCDDI